MSKQVDERVVEMRFDNKNFENNVKTTMSTLEKLKEKLKFSGASKGLEQINTSVKRVDMSGLGKSVDTVGLRFNAMYTMADQALRNITTRVQQTGERMLKALTIEPLMTGFQEYETQINAVQTILANTSAKGTDINDVNKALDELNKYADMTIYNFTEMTRNIGTFTAAGVDLDTSTKAIQGIANLAAVSGSTSQQASTAMYQLSQALAAGSVKLMDWNSVVNAGMGGEVFQNALKRTATMMGTNVDAMIEKYGSFRESLTQGEWITSEVLTKTLEQFTMAAEEGKDQWNEYKKSLMDEGYTEEQATEILRMANTATDAATKVKTFTQLWDVMKESVQSGWSQTWEILIGDFEEAKALLTPLSDFFTTTIGHMSDARNELLDSALGRGFTQMFDGMKEILSTTQKGIDGVLKPVQATTKALEDLGVTVDKVIGGQFGNGKERYDALTKAGINYYEVQNKVNESLGNSHRYTQEQIAAQDKLLGKQIEVTGETSEQVEETAELADEQKKQLKVLAAMTEEQLKAKGYTDEQIESLKELGVQADKLGLSVDEFIEHIDEINGRWLLINSFKTVGQSLVKIFQAMGQAWRDVFPPMQAEQLFNMIAGLHKFSQNLKMSDETAENLRSTLRGVFSIIDIIATITGGAFRIAFKLVTQLLGYFDMNLLDVTARIGDAIYQFDQWLNSIIDFTAVFDMMIPAIKKVIGFIGDLVDAFLKLPKVQAFIDRFQESFERIKNYDYASVGQDIIAGFVNGLGAGIKAAITAIVNFGKTLLEEFCFIIGVQSPSWKMFDIARDFVQGFLNGFASIARVVWSYIKQFGATCIDILKKVDWGAVFTVATVAGALLIGYKLANAIEAFSAPFESIGDLLDQARKTLKAFTTQIKAQALFTLAKSIALLAASVVVLTFIKPGKLWNAVGVIAALAAIVGGLTLVIGKWGPKETVELGKFSLSLAGIAASLLIVAIALKKVSDIDEFDLQKGTKAILALGGVIAALILATRMFKADSTKVGGTLILLSVAMLLLVKVVKQTSKLSDKEVTRGGLIVLGFVGIVTALTLVSKMAGSEIADLGKTMLLISASMLLLILVMKRAAQLDKLTLKRGTEAILLFTGIIAALTAVTRLAGGNDINKLGKTLILMAGAIAIMALIVKMLAEMDEADIKKGIVAITAFSGIITGLIAATRLFANKKEMTKLSGTLLMMAVAIGILAAVAAMLSFVKVESLAKGIVAVGLLSGMMSMMLVAARKVKNIKGNLIVLTIAIALMAGAVAALSLIDGSKLGVATAAMVGMMTAFSLMIAVTKFAKNTKSMRKTLLEMLGVVVVLGAVLAALSFIPNTDAAIRNAGAISILMTSLALSLGIMAKAGKISSTISKQIFPMLAVVAGLATILGLLSYLNVEAVLQNAASLSILLTAFASSMFILGYAGKISTTVSKQIFPMLAVVAGLSAILGLLGYLNIETSLQTVLGLSVLLMAFSGSLVLLSLAGNISKSVTKNLAPMIGVMAGLAVILGLLGALNKLGIEPSVNTVVSLSVLLVAFTAALAIMSLIGPGVIAADKAMLPLLKLIGIFSLIIAALGALSKIPGFNELIQDGGHTFALIGYALGEFVGSIVGGIGAGISSGLPAIGENLSLFMENVTPFIEGVKQVDDTALKGVLALSAAILALTAAEVIHGYASLLPISSSLAVMGSDLSMFMENVKPFIDGASTLTPESMEGVKSLADAIIILTAANLLEGITRFIGGSSSLATFGSELAGLGTNINTFATNLGSFSETQVETIRCAANAIKVMAEAASMLPNDGGWAGAILGENSISAFGDQLPGLGMNLCAFASNLEGFDKPQQNAVKCAAEAIVAMADAASKIPNEGGWAAKILGDNSIATFGAQLPLLGYRLSAFAINLGTFDESKVATVKCAANAIAEMANAAGNIDGQADWAAKIFGDNSLATFGSQLPGLGTNLSGFATNLGTFTEAQVTTVRCGIDAVKAFATLADTDLKGAKKHLTGFGGDLKTFGTNISEFCSTMPEASVISNACLGIRRLLSALGSINTTVTDSATQFSNSLKKMAKNGVEDFANYFKGATAKSAAKAGVVDFLNYVNKALTDSYSKSQMKDAGVKSVDSIIEGVESKQKDAKNSFENIPKDGQTAITDYYDEFYSAGADLVSGFVAGISDNIASAAAAAAEMAASAAAAAKANLQINSPSKVFRRIGSSVPEGFAQGIGKFGYMITEATDGMGDTAIAGLKGTIAKIGDAVNTDIDTQPTIRPVLDLSDIHNGAGTISGLFGDVGMTAKIDTVSSMMSGYSQNGGSAAIISAIDKLRNDLGNIGGTSYSINGITYDDGSNVATAIGEIARAALRERRM